MGKMYFGLFWIWKRPMIRSIAHHVADAKSVWSWRKIIQSVQSSYADSRACILIGMDVSEWFPVNVGLRQDCVISP